MRDILKFATKLYPAWWRNRYGAEFDALLEDAKPGWWDVLDILRGAIEMHMSFKTRACVALVCGVAGVALTLGASLLMPVKYESRVILLAQDPRQLDFQRVFNPLVLASIIEARGLYLRERSSQSMDDVITKMKRTVSIQPTGGRLLAVSFVYEDPALAQQTAQDLAAQLTNPSQQSTETVLQLIDPPSLPRSPVSPARVNMAIFGLGAGLLLGLVLLVILPSPQRLEPV